MIYEIQRRIAAISQENTFISMYFTRLKQIWDELSTMEVLPPCTCDVSKIMDGIYNKQKVMRFLMGLNNTFESVKDRMLMMGPLPSVSKAYSIVMKFEAQKQISSTFFGSFESVALFNKTQHNFPSHKREHKKYD